MSDDDQTPKPNADGRIDLQIVPPPEEDPEVALISRAGMIEQVRSFLATIQSQPETMTFSSVLLATTRVFDGQSQHFVLAYGQTKASLAIAKEAFNEVFLTSRLQGSTLGEEFLQEEAEKALAAAAAKEAETPS